MKADRARLFALLWLIGSLVFMPFLTGAITTMLTVTVMETKVIIPKSDGTVSVGLNVYYGIQMNVNRCGNQKLRTSPMMAYSRID